MGDVLPLKPILRRRNRKWVSEREKRPTLKRKTGLDFTHWIRWVWESSDRIDERSGHNADENVFIWRTLRKLERKHDLTEEEAELAWALYNRWREKKQQKEEHTQAG